MTTPVPEPDQQPAGEKPEEPVEDVKPSRVERRRERLRAEIHEARHGNHLIPTWLLTTILVVIVVGWLYLIYSA